MKLLPTFYCRGFTLVELMVTVAVVAILATIAAPQMQEQITGSRVTGVTNELIGELARARSDAIRLNQQVSVNPNNIAGGRVNIESDPEALANNVTFNSNGTLAAAAPTPPNTTRTITLSIADRTRTIEILGSGKAFVSN